MIMIIMITVMRIMIMEILGSIVGGHPECDVFSYHSDHDYHGYGDEDRDDGDFR